MSCKSKIFLKRDPKEPPFTSKTLSFFVKVFMMEASIDPVPEQVIKATLLPSLALANFSINFSFSNIKLENSCVLKYGTCLSPIFLTLYGDWTGPTAKFFIY